MNEIVDQINSRRKTRKTAKYPRRQWKGKWCEQCAEIGRGRRERIITIRKNIRITVNDGNNETNLFSDMTSGMHRNKNRHFVRKHTLTRQCTLGLFLSFFRYSVAHPKVFAKKSNKKGNNVKKRQQIYIPSISFARMHIYHFPFLGFRIFTSLRFLAHTKCNCWPIWLCVSAWCVQQIERAKLLLPVLAMRCENE